MAVAYAISAMRVPGHRKDFWFTLTFVLTGTVCCLEIALATHGALAIARACLAGQAFLLFFLAIAFHAQYQADVFDARGRRRHLAMVILHGALGAVLIPMIVGGVMDGGHVHVVERLGVRAAMITLPP
jgi:hypothetical protein